MTRPSCWSPWWRRIAEVAAVPPFAGAIGYALATTGSAKRRQSLTAILWLTAFVGLTAASPPSAAKQPPPKVMLWSWFADDDFHPLADRPVGVAYLALSLQFDGQNQVEPSPRSIPVRIPPKMYQMVVVRFDNRLDTSGRPAFSAQQRELAVDMIGETVDLARPQGVQIDFDAPRTAWPLYRQLLFEVRKRIGPSVFLSMTALVSWCGATGSWLSELPVDEIVPMAFSMGQATPAIVTMLQRGGQFQFAGCRPSIGVELPVGYTVPPGHDYDLLVRPRSGQRAYFFVGAQKWSHELVLRAQKAFLP
ncbi:MAG: hypothetical protein U0Q18_22210 [Bryobacteraceae bacterium]